MNKFSFFFLVFSFSLWALPAQDVIYFDAANPPFMYQKNGAAGLYPAVVKEIYRRLGKEVLCVSVPWIRAVSEAKNSLSGIGGLYRNSEREITLDFTDSLYQEKIAVYTLKSSSIRVKALSDLHGKRIGVIRGWSYGNHFDAIVKGGKILIEENTSDKLNIQKLMNRRLDAVIAVVHSGDRIVDALDSENAIERGDPILYLDVHLAFNKKMEKKIEIMKINKVIDEMKKDGTIRRIELAEMENYFQTSD